jgi:hypothetical protein
MRHRLGQATVTVRAHDGGPFEDTEVSVGQRRHGFLFGCTGFDLIPLANDEIGPNAPLG